MCQPLLDAQACCVACIKFAFVSSPLRGPHIRTRWSEVRRLVASIRHANVTASLMLRKLGRPFGNALLQHIAPVHWNHINLTGDYSWRQNKRVEKGGLRPLRIPRG